MNRKRALIFGLEGQDGYYLSRFLLKQNYQVYGMVRKKACHDLTISPEDKTDDIVRLYGDITDFASIMDCLRIAAPDEIYNLAGQSDIPLSWRQPEATAQVNAVAPLRILESVRQLGTPVRFFQASSSEMYGNNQGHALDEKSYFAPRNPYGTSKLAAHWGTINYRESYDMYACCGILFNHESVRRGHEFVTRKITATVAKIHLGLASTLEMGNLDAVRDWGHAEDYVRAMWLMLQQQTPHEYVIATGIGHTVRDFVIAAFQKINIQLRWEGKGLEEVAYGHDGRVLVSVHPEFYRYPQKDVIVGCPHQLMSKLGFVHQHSFEKIVGEMVVHDINSLKKFCCKS